MIMMNNYLLILVLYIKQVFLGKITPWGRKPIELSINNQNLLSDYTFKFQIDTDLEDNDLLVIQFPPRQFITILTSSFTCNADLLPEEGIKYTIITALNCQFVLNRGLLLIFCGILYIKGFVVVLPELKATEYTVHQVTIKDIMNPLAGGTGMFKLQTMRGQRNIFDYNHFFGQIGIVGDPSLITGSSFIRTLNSVNDIADYTFSFTTINLLPQGGCIMLELVNSDIQIPNDTVCTTDLAVAPQCTWISNSKIKIAGFSGDIGSGGHNIKLTKLKHSSSVVIGGPGSVKIQTFQNNSNTIIDRLPSLAITDITAGIISQSATDNWYSNYIGLRADTFYLSPSDTIEYQFQFRLKNQLIQGSTIQYIVYNKATAGFEPQIASGCYSHLGLEDISQSQQVQCVITNALPPQYIMTLSDFREVQANALIGITFTAKNEPVAGAYIDGAIGQPRIVTYDPSLNKVDDSIGPSPSHSINVGKIYGASIAVSTIQSSNSAAQIIGQTITISFRLPAPDQPIAAVPTTVQVQFPQQFSFGASICTFTTSNPVVVDFGPAACTISNNKVIITVTSEGNIGDTLTGTDNILAITPINNPALAGDYPISLFIQQGAVTLYHQTFSHQITPAATIGSESVQPIFRDYQTETVYIIKFTTPNEIIPSGAFPYSFSNPQGSIYIEFSTWTAGACTAPAVPNLEFDLVLGLTEFSGGAYIALIDGKTFPCYGIQNLIPVKDNLKCTIYKPPGASTIDFVGITVTDFQQIPANSLVEFHIPKMKNSQCIDQNPTSYITLQKKVNRVLYKMYKTGVITIQFPCKNLRSLNAKNSNGPGGTSTNLAPIFSPNIVSRKSATKVFITPGAPATGRDFTLTQGLPSILMQFPRLGSNLVPYFFSVSIKCSIGLSNVQTCYTYPDVGWILVHNLNVNFPLIPTETEDFVYLQEIINPYVAQNFIDVLRIITIDDVQLSDITNYMRQMELVEYLSFNTFVNGEVPFAQVYGEHYEANRIDVTYEWFFKLEHDIPQGGVILLKFPPNFYNLDRLPTEPQPRTSFLAGELISITPTPNFFVYAVNVLKIQNFVQYKAGSLIGIRVESVKNPPEPGLTTDYEIESKNSESLTIDRKIDIPAVKILNPMPVGQITYNNFVCTPWNGNPSGFDVSNDSPIKGSYELSFIPITTLPYIQTYRKEALIEVIFPLNFEYTYFLPFKYYEFGGPEPDPASNIDCELIGVLKTAEQCKIKQTTIPVVIQIKLDKKLHAFSGINPIIIRFHNIYNFNPELSSSVVTVRSLYDNVILDDSGNLETNRKATTGLQAQKDSLNVIDFSHFPITEGSLSNYSFKVQPTHNISFNHTIQLIFPSEFGWDLGEQISANSSELEIPGSSLNVSINKLTLNITNISRFDIEIDPQTGKNVKTFNLTICNIRNPQYTASQLTGQIDMYILDTTSNISQYKQQVGKIQNSIAAPVIYIPEMYQTNTTQTRIISDFSLIFKSSKSSITFTNIITTMPFPQFLSIQNFFNRSIAEAVVITPSDSISAFKNMTYLFYTSSNNIYLNYQGSLAMGDYLKLHFLNLFTPFDPGIALFPILSTYDNSTLLITGQTYNNLNQFEIPDYYQMGNIIYLQTDNNKDLNLIDIEAGSYSQIITALFPGISSSKRTIFPLIRPSYGVILDPIINEAGKLNTDFKIGIADFINATEITIEWKCEGFNPIRPIKIQVWKRKDINIFIEDIGEVPAGGRTSPKVITLEKGPFQDLTIELYIKGYVPSKASIFPWQLKFLKGETTKYFWVSVDKDSDGYAGTVLVMLKGANYQIYSLPQREYNFIIINPEISPPLLIGIKPIVTNTFNSISLNLATNEPCTVYFSLQEINSFPITLQDIKKKKIPYDYSKQKAVVLGEYINNSTAYNYSIEINNLPSFTFFQLQIYVEDLSGNLINNGEPYAINVSTNATEIFPVQIYMELVNVTKKQKTKELIQLILDTIANVTQISRSRLIPEEQIPEQPPYSLRLKPYQLDYNQRRMLQNSSNVSNISSQLTNITQQNNNTQQNITKIDWQYNQSFEQQAYEYTSSGVILPKNSQDLVLFSFLILPERNDITKPSSYETVLLINKSLDEITKLSNISFNKKFANNQTILQGFLDRRHPLWKSKPKIKYILKDTIVIDNIQLNQVGRVYALVVNRTYPLYRSTQKEDEKSIRYLQKTVFNISTINSNIQESGVYQEIRPLNDIGKQFLFDNKDYQWTSYPNNFLNSTKEYEETTYFSLPIRNHSQVCNSQNQINYVTIYCNGVNAIQPNWNRSDIIKYQPYRLPLPIQIFNGVDAYNFIPIVSGYVKINETNKKFRLVLNGMKPSTDYTLFLISADNISSFPTLMNGTNGSYSSDIYDSDLGTMIVINFTTLNENPKSINSYRIYIIKISYLLLILLLVLYYKRENQN